MAGEHIDHWQWRAHLTDGTIIPERDADGAERGWAAVPADRVQALELAPVGEGRAPAWLDVPDGATAWLGRRRQLVLRGDGTQERLASVTILRWTLGERALWLYVADDGTVAASDREIA